MGEVNISGWGWYAGGHYVKHAPAEKLTEEKMLLRLSQQTTKTKQVTNYDSLHPYVFRNLCYLSYLLLLLLRSWNTCWIPRIKDKFYPVTRYLLKVSYRNSRTKGEIKLRWQERHHSDINWRPSCFFIDEHWSDTHTHTHTHTRANTHTHTHAHMHTQIWLIKILAIENWLYLPGSRYYLYKTYIKR